MRSDEVGDGDSMKYENAKDVLPEELLKQVQAYAAGKLIYVPIENAGKSWGEVSGIRQKLRKRNMMICNQYRSGMTLSELAEEYCLSLDSIKKIVYCKEEKNLVFTTSVESAISFANAGLTEEWLHMFCDQRDMTDLRGLEESITLGVLKMPLRLISHSVTTDRSKPLGTTAVHLGQPEPLIVRYEANRFFAEGQTEMLEALRVRKINAYPTLIIVSRVEEYKTFMNLFGRHFISMNKI